MIMVSMIDRPPGWLPAKRSREAVSKAGAGTRAPGARCRLMPLTPTAPHVVVASELRHHNFLRSLSHEPPSSNHSLCSRDVAMNSGPPKKTAKPGSLSDANRSLKLRLPSHADRALRLPARHTCHTPRFHRPPVPQGSRVRSSSGMPLPAAAQRNHGAALP